MKLSHTHSDDGWYFIRTCSQQNRLVSDDHDPTYPMMHWGSNETNQSAKCQQSVRTLSFTSTQQWSKHQTLFIHLLISAPQRPHVSSLLHLRMKTSEDEVSVSLLCCHDNVTAPEAPANSSVSQTCGLLCSLHCSLSQDQLLIRRHYQSPAPLAIVSPLITLRRGRAGPVQSPESVLAMLTSIRVHFETGLGASERRQRLLLLLCCHGNSFIGC